MYFYYNIIHHCYTHAVNTTSEPSETCQALTLKSRNAENQYNNFCTG